MKTVLSICCFVLCIQLCAQTNLVEPNPIEHDVHKRNIGLITFMPSTIPIENYAEKDFLKSCELTTSTNLYARVFLSNSLSNYMHRLAPTLTTDELNKIGNFQFAFYVDKKLVYTENLNQGAFGPENKNKSTTFRIPLATTQNEDSWGRFLWNRFMMKGGDDALTAGSHRLKIEIRPYVNNSEEKVGELIAQGEITLIKKDREIPDRELLPAPIKAAQGWEISKASFGVSKIKELKAAILRENLKQITSVVVIKDGKLLLEEYFNGASRKSLHDTRSVGKTFTSALMGLAISDGYIKTVNQPLSDFYELKNFKNYSDKKANVTIKNLLTMSSAFDGFDFDSNSIGNEENMYPQENWVKWTLDLPMAQREPSAEWAYFTAGVVVLGDILDKTTPNGLEKYAAEKLFKHLDIKNYQWQYTPQKVVNTAGGLQLSSLDLAKFGQLYLNKGSWSGKQILPVSWVEESLSKQIAVPMDGMNYGYLFWNQKFKTEDGEYESFYLSGNGGNKVHILKDLNAVVVITAKAYNTPYMHQQSDKIVAKFLIPAMEGK